MSIDELGRVTGRRTTDSMVASTDPFVALRDLQRVRRRRTNVKVGAVATALVLALGVWWGTAGQPFRHTAPATPRPNVAPSAPVFKAAPPLCNPLSYAPTFGLGKYLTGNGACGAGAGRYLGLNGRHLVFKPYLFTLPAGWVVEGIPARVENDVQWNGGGLLLRNIETGDAIAFTVYPVPADDPTDRLVGALTPEQIADLVYQAGSVNAAKLVSPMVDGVLGYGYNVWVRGGTSYSADDCLVEACYPVLRVWSDPPPDLGRLGVVDDRPSRVIAFSHGSLPVLIWMWGPRGAVSVDEDPELTGIVRSIDLDPAGVILQVPVDPSS